MPTLLFFKIIVIGNEYDSDVPSNVVDIARFWKLVSYAPIAAESSPRVENKFVLFLIEKSTRWSLDERWSMAWFESIWNSYFIYDIRQVTTTYARTYNIYVHSAIWMGGARRGEWCERLNGTETERTLYEKVKRVRTIRRSFEPKSYALVQVSHWLADTYVRFLKLQRIHRGESFINVSDIRYLLSLCTTRRRATGSLDTSSRTKHRDE